MLKLPNFESRYNIIKFTLKFILRRSRSQFADIIKTATRFIKITFKNKKEVKLMKKLCIKVQSMYVFLDITKVAGLRLKEIKESIT